MCCIFFQCSSIYDNVLSTVQAIQKQCFTWLNKKWEYFYVRRVFIDKKYCKLTLDYVFYWNALISLFIDILWGTGQDRSKVFIHSGESSTWKFHSELYFSEAVTWGSACFFMWKGYIPLVTGRRSQTHSVMVTTHTRV